MSLCLNFAVILAYTVAAFAAELELPADSNLPVACLELLQTGNVQGFATRAVPSLADWEAEAHRFGRGLTPEQREELERDSQNNLANLTRAGNEILNLGRRLKIISPNSQWVFKRARVDKILEVTSSIHRRKETISTALVVQLRFSRFSSENAESHLNGDYAIDFQLGERFPGGWRIFNGARWSAFPAGAVSVDLEKDMALAEALPVRGTELAQSQDVALQSLGQKVISMFNVNNPEDVVNELLAPSDLVLRISRERDPQRKILSRKVIEKHDAELRKNLSGSIRTAVAQADRLGLDLTKAKVEDIRVEGFRARYSNGLPLQFGGRELYITFAIPGATNLSGKTFPAGNCVLASAHPERILGRWYLQELRWVSFPQGALSPEDLRKQEFENFVAKNRYLPPTTPAPEIELFTLEPHGSGKSAQKTSVKLSDFRGKYVVLEWWATWCGPCQEPIAELQKAFETHPQWRDKVELITVSIDDKAETARKHLEKQGWTKTLNYWSGGDWNSAPAKAFRVTAVPTTYVIEPDGRILLQSVSSWASGLEQRLKSLEKN